MQCPKCKQRNPAHAESCLHCNERLVDAFRGHDSAPGGEHEPGDRPMDKILSWLLFFGLIALAIYNWDTIRTWFWTADFTSVQCVHSYESDEFPESEGWRPHNCSPSHSHYSSGTKCYERDYQHRDVFDERFQPDDVKREE